MVVNDFLLQYFPDILDFHFTAKVEEEFDEIAEGKLNWTKMLKDFYKPFHKIVEKTTENSERQSGERELGIDPVSKKKVIVRIGRFGPLAQIGETNEEKGTKAQFAGLRKDQRMETITLEQALLLFKMPRVVGEFEGKEMKVGIGRFGPYVVHDSKFTSLTKEDDPYTVGGERCIELIKAKREKDLAKIIKTFPENPNLKVQFGRWGPCITLGKDFFRIPKDKEPAKLSFGDVVEIIGGIDAYEQVIANAEKKNKKFGAKKEKAAPKAKATKNAKGKSAKVVSIKTPVKKVSVKKPVYKKAASKTTAPKRVIKATRKKATKRK